MTDQSDGYYMYCVACDRVLHDVIRLVEARGGNVKVRVDPGRLPTQAITDTHHIQLTCRASSRILEVDHDTFIDAGFFRTLVLHQVDAAITELQEPKQHARRA